MYKINTNHLQYSSPVEALNLIVESKSLPVELNNSTIELHVPSRRKKSLQSYCSVDFDFLVLMLFDRIFAGFQGLLKQFLALDIFFS